MIATTEEEMLDKVFDFVDKEVHEVMVPRPQVVAISIEMPTEEALAALLASPYTRYPVYRDSLDEIVGILHVRDLFSALHDRGIANVDLEELLRPYIVPRDELTWRLAEFGNQDHTWRSSPTSTGRCRGSRRSATCSRRLSARSKTSSTPDESVERIDDTHVRIDVDLPDRRLQRAVRPTRSRTTTRWPESFLSASLAGRPRSGTKWRSTGSRCA